MKKTRPVTFAIIGAGMVGTAIGALLQKAGYPIAAIADLSEAHLKRAASYIQAPLFRNAAEAALAGHCILISTPDDLIQIVCEDLARTVPLKGKTVFHLSGACGLDVLAPASLAGAAVACIHPLQSFSSIDAAMASIPGSYFGVTAGRGAKSLARNIVRDLQGIALVITEEQKPLYHAAACIASNYLVSLMSVVEAIYLSIGLTEKDARKAYLPLVYGSLKNIENQGCAQALTGPIARGDVRTVDKHVEVLTGKLAHSMPVYAELGKIAVKLAKQKGTLNARQARSILDLLKGE